MRQPNNIEWNRQRFFIACSYVYVLIYFLGYHYFSVHSLDSLQVQYNRDGISWSVEIRIGTAEGGSTECDACVHGKQSYWSEGEIYEVEKLVNR